MSTLQVILSDIGVSISFVNVWISLILGYFVKKVGINLVFVIVFLLSFSEFVNLQMFVWRYVEYPVSLSDFILNFTFVNLFYFYFVLF